MVSGMKKKHGCRPGPCRVPFRWHSECLVFSVSVLLFFWTTQHLLSNKLVASSNVSACGVWAPLCPGCVAWGGCSASPGVAPSPADVGTWGGLGEQLW